MTMMIILLLLNEKVVVVMTTYPVLFLAHSFLRTHSLAGSLAHSYTPPPPTNQLRLVHALVNYKDKISLMVNNTVVARNMSYTGVSKCAGWWWWRRRRTMMM